MYYGICIIAYDSVIYMGKNISNESCIMSICIKNREWFKYEKIYYITKYIEFLLYDFQVWLCFLFWFEKRETEYIEISSSSILAYVCYCGCRCCYCEPGHDLCYFLHFEAINGSWVLSTCKNYPHLKKMKARCTFLHIQI